MKQSSMSVIILTFAIVPTTLSALTYRIDTAVARDDNEGFNTIVNNQSDTAYIDSVFIKADSACFQNTDTYSYNDVFCFTMGINGTSYDTKVFCSSPPPNYYADYCYFAPEFEKEEILHVPPNDSVSIESFFSWNIGGYLTKRASLAKAAGHNGYHIASVIVKTRTQGQDTVEYRGHVLEALSGKRQLTAKTKALDNTLKDMSNGFYTPLGRSIPSLSRYHKRGVVISSEGRILLLQ